ncbi:D-sedoheptulose-7-phosphate isomerase [Paramicrobacterium agarici]|uniref:D-sedoheptulose 7-phosphate isomerase/type III pantothenate kinase n=1 Tax=Paramicrobacterium agarici TaxID=630514 RepID=A0A2A9DYX3_9MICO|nr:SIS domain-containing protein [Microbacterium agarici]PFG31794.1 D-sedoheptulose 7-phosphate isomerase/type III pantothenate kinase [Microbacterium agarici]
MSIHQSISASPVERHLVSLRPVLDALDAESGRLDRWGRTLAARLMRGNRMLAAGNGGSAAEAQHFTAELVGRFDGERRPFSAIALHADTSAVTAIGNDYGYDEVFARQVSGHARHGDVVVLLSTSGASRNLLLAAKAASASGATTWALTGAGPNPLSSVVDECLCLPGPAANVQEAQLVAVHAICRAFDAAVAEAEKRSGS